MTKETALNLIKEYTEILETEACPRSLVPFMTGGLRTGLKKKR